MRDAAVMVLATTVFSLGACSSSDDTTPSSSSSGATGTSGTSGATGSPSGPGFSSSSGGDRDASGDLPSGGICTPGNRVYCKCADRTAGTKACSDDGKSFGACVCTDGG